MSVRTAPDQMPLSATLVYLLTRRAAIVEYPDPCLFCRAGIVILGRPEWRCWQHGGFR